MEQGVGWGREMAGRCCPRLEDGVASCNDPRTVAHIHHR
jgi:hypothetical protein